MASFEIQLLVIFCAVLRVSITEARFNCNSNPPKIEFIENCCKLPETNKEAYAAECGSFDFVSPLPDLCTLECLFNVSQSIKNDSLDEENLERMLNAFIPTDKAFVKFLLELYIECFGRLGHQLHKRLVLKKVKATTIATTRCSEEDIVEVDEDDEDAEDDEPLVGCSNLPMRLASCTSFRILKSCPKERWNHTKECERTRKYVKSCIV